MLLVASIFRGFTIPNIEAPPADPSTTIGGVGDGLFEKKCNYLTIVPPGAEQANPSLPEITLVLLNAQHVAPAEAADKNGNDADAEVKELRLKVEQMAQEMGQQKEYVSQLETKNLLLENENNGETTLEANATSIDSACQKEELQRGPNPLFMIIVFGSVGFGVFNLLVQYINIRCPPKDNPKWNTVFVGIRYSSIAHNCFVSTVSLYAFTNQSFSIATIVVATILCFTAQTLQKLSISCRYLLWSFRRFVPVCWH
uniref:Uncharacterized protein n=1 Tax=Globodera rostochiensis TaxID=31243 RepID=A0A914GQG7_GLORO